jgi:hypothetical protein
MGGAMSSIVIFGDVSGSATLTAPAVAGSPVITLPTTSGTLAAFGATTVNGVVYTDATGAPVSGSSLTFNGTTFTNNGNTVLGDASTDTLNVGNGGLVKDASGNFLVGISSNVSGVGTSGAGRVLSKASASTSANNFLAYASTNDAVLTMGHDGSLGTIATTYAASAGYTPLTFNTSGSERMRIDIGGNLIVGATSVAGNERLHVIKDANNQEVARFYNSNSSSPYGIMIYYSGIAPNNGTNAFIGCYDTVGTKAAIRSNGGISNYSGNNVNLSDRREKTNFAPAKSYLDTICAIPVQTFNYIDQNMEEDGGLTLGVVAQDVQAVAPELVTETNWAGKDEEPKMRLSIYQTDLQYALMKCIQEQQALITTLTDRITALEGAK